MQHHDGITATSKGWIMKEMQDKMRDVNNDIFNSLKDINKVEYRQCNLMENNNECYIPDVESDFVLSLYHYGTPKNERIEVRFPPNKVFEPANFRFSSYDIFCDTNKCAVMLSVPLASGSTHVNFTKTAESAHQAELKEAHEGSHGGIRWSKANNVFKYIFGQEDKTIEISYH